MRINQKPKTDYQLSVLAGKTHNFLAIMKRANRDQYDYIKIVGISEFEDEQLKLRKDLSEMQIDLTETRLASKFCRDYLSDIFLTPHVFLNTISRFAFTNQNYTMNYRAFKRWQSVLYIYDKNKQKFYEEN